MQWHIQNRRGHFQKSAGDLLPGSDLNGQLRILAAAQKLGYLPGPTDAGRIAAGALSSEHIQKIPAHSVDRGGGKHQTGGNIGINIHTEVGGAAGLFQPVSQHLCRQLLNPGRLGNGAVQTADPAFRIGDRQTGALGTYQGGESHRNQRRFAGLISLAHLPQPCAVFLFLLPDAKHLGAGIGGEVTVGKALAVKGGVQLLLHMLGNVAAIQRLAVDLGYSGHILRPLHPALQLQRGNTHILNILQVMHQTVVLQAQRILILPAAVAITLAAGLSAATPVAGAAADGSGQIALTAVAHAQSAMAENFNLNGRILANVADLFPVQFPTEHHPAQTPGSAQQHAGQRVDAHLGGAVDGHIRRHIFAQTDHAQILDDKSIYTTFRGMADQSGGFAGFLVRNQGVQRQMDRNAPDMTVFHSFR